MQISYLLWYRNGTIGANTIESEWRTMKNIKKATKKKWGWIKDLN